MGWKTIQLKGKKKWKIKVNNTVRNMDYSLKTETTCCIKPLSNNPFTLSLCYIQPSRADSNHKQGRKKKT